MSDTDSGLDPEDAKLLILARSSRARTGAVEGAAVRDTDGRTYAASTVTLPSLRLTALQVAVAMAVSSGAVALEAAAVVTEALEADERSVACVNDLTAGTTILVADVTGLPKRWRRAQTVARASVGVSRDARTDG
jgi:hypothetical protein